MPGMHLILIFGVQPVTTTIYGRPGGQLPLQWIIIAPVIVGVTTMGGPCCRHQSYVCLHQLLSC